MAKGTLGTIITWGVVGVGAWWLYETYFAGGSSSSSSGSTPLPAGVPSSAAANGYQNTGGGTQATPATGDVWVNSSGGVVAIFQNGAWQSPLACILPQATVVNWLHNGGAFPCPSNASIVPPNPNGGTPATGSTVTSPSISLASIHTALQQAVASSGDPAISTPPTLNQNNPDYNFLATPVVFNYYLQQVWHGAVLDMAQVFPGQNTGFTLAQFWAGVSPKLQAAGLSGIMSGLGYLVNAGRGWPEVAINPWNGGEWPAGGRFWWQGGAGRAVQ